jgi:hypothetical protein
MKQQQPWERFVVSKGNASLAAKQALAGQEVIEQEVLFKIAGLALHR